MNKSARKLINDVGIILKYISESYSVPFPNGRKVKVEYDLSHNKALVHLPPEIRSTGNGHERYYSHTLLGNLAGLSKKHGISYKIGLADNLDFHVLIYV